MQVDYKSESIRKVCTDIREAERRHGSDMAKKIHMRIDQISSASSVEEMVQGRIGRCHPLHGKRQGQYAMDLLHPWRLVFTKKGDAVQIAFILEIVNYH